MTTAAIGLCQRSRPSFITGWTKPRMADEPSGKARSQSPLTVKACHCRLYISTTPATIAAIPNSCKRRRCSPSSVIANSTANTGANPPTAPAMFGPMRRLDSKFESVTAAGKSSPIPANKPAALKSTSAGSIEKGARHQNKSVDVGTLKAAPSRGGIRCNANWVSINAAPKPKVENSAKRTASGLLTNDPSVRVAVVRTVEKTTQWALDKSNAFIVLCSMQDLHHENERRPVAHFRDRRGVGRRPSSGRSAQFESAGRVQADQRA